MMGPNFVLHRGDRRCQYFGCGRAARGASGLCISHGGGRRCLKPGCCKGAAKGGTAYCKAHGGGPRCQRLGRTKSASGRTDFCIAYGGGQRCSQEGCGRVARCKTGLCIRHGGSKRCQNENCTESAEGLSGLCISHGGGRRCQHLGCTRGAQGDGLCTSHGGDGDGALVEDIGVHGHGGATLGPMVHEKMEEEIAFPPSLLKPIGGRKSFNSCRILTSFGNFDSRLRQEIFDMFKITCWLGLSNQNTDTYNYDATVDRQLKSQDKWWAAGGDAVKKDLGMSLEVLLAFAFPMAAAPDVRNRTAKKELRGEQLTARPTVVVNDAKDWGVIKVPKDARISVLPTVAGSGAVKKGAHLSARGMVEGKGVHSKVVGFVRRVCMVGLNSVLHMGVVRGVLFRSAQRAHVGVPTFVSVTVGERGANPKDVERVHREPLILARNMVEARDAPGANLSQSLVKAHGVCKRCQSEGCGNTAQGSTGFCNAHAGVKRCSWGQRESELGQGEEPRNSFAWEMTRLCTFHGARSIGALVQDKLVRRGATLRPMFLDSESSKPEKMEEVVIAVEGMNEEQ
ncbi:hypothetical protein RHMOL_Rhmol02G0297300 [Rhododendron molle]|uniref:Uncharacterized protein n=1 Tax=Rhododendron molle TaxID=49168 RepID=A0ACC0PYT4_RHOML|nr:hypothetical protein RHMOL_Rhmol02G0297300 [Rhododendron molle]